MRTSINSATKVSFPPIPRKSYTDEFLYAQKIKSKKVRYNRGSPYQTDTAEAKYLTWGRIDTERKYTYVFEMFDKAELREISECFTEALNLSKGDLTLLRAGQNALFVSRKLLIVIRVYRGEDMMQHAIKEVEFSSLLARSRIPSVQITQNYGGPIIRAGGYIASLWGWLAPDDTKATTYELGEIIREIHQLANGPGVPEIKLPLFDPIKSAERRMSVLRKRNVLSRPHLKLLEDHLETAKRIWLGFESTRRKQIIHGDAHTGNLIVSDRIVHICDFDSVSIGPIEIDAVPVAVIAKRFLPKKVGFVEDFDQGYGADETLRKKANSLIPVRELTMTTWLAQDAQPGTERFAELECRINSLSEKDNFTRWHPK